jgi:hypothetical protein
LVSGRTSHPRALGIPRLQQQSVTSRLWLIDPGSGERYADVIMLWVGSESDKPTLVQDLASPFFTTDHFEGHPSVLIRASRLAEISTTELTELIQDAWLSRASTKRAAAWLADHSSRSTGALWGWAKPRRINPGQV